MRDFIKRLDAEYGFGLSEEEIEVITRQAEAQQRLFQELFEVDLAGVTPALKLDRKRIEK